MPLNRKSCLGGSCRTLKSIGGCYLAGPTTNIPGIQNRPNFCIEGMCCKSCALKVHVAVVVWPMPLVPPHPIREGTGWGVLSSKYFTALSG